MSIFCRILLIEKYWEPIAQKSFGQDWKWDWKLENVRVKPHVVVAATGSSLVQKTYSIGMYQPHNAKKCYLYWKIQIISFLDVALHPWRHSMATKGVEGSKSVLKAANDAGGDSLLFCVRKCDQKSLPQVKNYYTQSFSITNCQSFGWKCGQCLYKPFII